MPDTDDLVFSLGIHVSRQTPEERRKKRIEKQRKQNKKTNPTSKNILQSQQPLWFTKYFKEITEQNKFGKMPIFNLFPNLPFSFVLDMCIPSLTQQEWVLQGWSKPPFGKPENWIENSFWSPEIVEGIKQSIFKCNQLRWIFRRFLTKWRLSRFQKVNEEDLFTCEVPKYPIQIVDWNSKSIWVFEAQSLMKDITNRLLHHDGCFEEPLAARNPYTNLPLTASQTISVWSQLMRYPVPASFPFTAYRASRMNLTQFRNEHRIFLSLHALRESFKEITYYETREKMLDFIEIAFDRQAAEVNIEAYEWALKHLPNTEQLHKWKHLCLKYHEFEVKYAIDDEARKKAQDKVFVQTFPLLHQQTEILQLFEEHNARPTIEVTNIAEVLLYDLLEGNPHLLGSTAFSTFQLFVGGNFLTDL